MKMSIWRRLNATLAILIGLLLLAGGLAWWIERTLSEADHTSEVLNAANYRILYNLSRMNHSFRALLTDQRLEAATNTLHEAEKDLLSALEGLREGFPGQPGLGSSLQNLQDFVLRTSSPFRGRLVELAQSDSVAADAFYRDGFPAIQERRDQLLADFKRQIQSVTDADAIHAQRTAVIGLVCIVAVCLGAMVVARFQSTAVTVPLNQLVAAL